MMVLSLQTTLQLLQQVPHSGDLQFHVLFSALLKQSGLVELCVLDSPPHTTSFKTRPAISRQFIIDKGEKMVDFNHEPGEHRLVPR